MKWTKRIIIALAILSGMLAVLSPAVYDQVNMANQKQWDPTVQRAEAMDFIKTKGIGPELNDLLARGPKPDKWLATYVMEGNGPLGTSNGPIVAADPVDLVGKSHMAAAGARPSFPSMSTSGASVTAPDGRNYTLWLAGVSEPVNPARWIRTAGGVLVAVAWLALAAWVYLDARQRRNASAPAWLLLAVLSGPVGFTVWLISRPDRSIGCPGCGVATTKGAAFCVRCGHALQPACPDCRRPVEIDWAYCATCGTNLAE